MIDSRKYNMLLLLLLLLLLPLLVRVFRRDEYLSRGR